MSAISARLRSTTLIGVLLTSTWIAAPARAGDPPDAPSPASVADSAPAADDEAYKASIASARRKYFADAMSGLSAQQLETFWSVYADFERDKSVLVDARVGLVRSYAEGFFSATGLSDAELTKQVQEMATLQRQLIDLRTKYFDIYSRRIDTKTAGRFALVDDYVATSVRLEWLKQIPFPGDEQR